jgi:hypothetical protein
LVFHAFVYTSAIQLKLVGSKKMLVSRGAGS